MFLLVEKIAPAAAAGLLLAEKIAPAAAAGLQLWTCAI